MLPPIRIDPISFSNSLVFLHLVENPLVLDLDAALVRPVEERLAEEVARPAMLDLGRRHPVDFFMAWQRQQRLVDDSVAAAAVLPQRAVGGAERLLNHVAQGSG